MLMTPPPPTPPPPLFEATPLTAIARILKCLSAAEKQRLRAASRGAHRMLSEAFQQPTEGERVRTVLEVRADVSALPSLAQLRGLFGLLQPSARAFASVELRVCDMGDDLLGALLERLTAIEGASECVRAIRFEVAVAAAAAPPTRVDSARLRLLLRGFGEVRRVVLAYVFAPPVAVQGGGVGGAFSAKSDWHDALRVFKTTVASLPPDARRDTEICTLPLSREQRALRTVVGLPASFSFGKGLDGLTALRLGPFDKKAMLFSWTTLEEGLCGMQQLRALEVRGLGTPLPVRLNLPVVLRNSLDTLESVVLEVPVLQEAQRAELCRDSLRLALAAPRLWRLEVGYSEHPVQPSANGGGGGGGGGADALWEFPSSILMLRVFQLVRERDRRTLAESMLTMSDD